MAAVVIRNLPQGLHRRLKLTAQRHHRSMNREIIAILENEVAIHQPAKLPPPVKGIKPVDPQWIVRVIREARDSRP